MRSISRSTSARQEGCVHSQAARSEPSAPRFWSTRTGAKPRALRLASISLSGTSAPMTRSSSARVRIIFLGARLKIILTRAELLRVMGEDNFLGCALAGIDVDDTGKKFASSELQDELGAASRSKLGHFRIGAAAKARGGFGVKLQVARGAANGDRIKPGAPKKI